MFKKGTVILVPFPFTDLSAQKLRPAVILSDSLSGDDFVAAFISSQLNKNPHQNEIVLKKTDPEFQQTGLKTDSVIKVAKIATLDRKIALGELGSVGKQTVQHIDEKLKILFGL